jgi:hypothetical protein
MWRTTVTAAVLSTSMICALASHSSASAANAGAEGQPCKGTLEIGDKTYPLKYAVAYPVKVFDKDGYNVLFADQAIPVEKLRAALANGKGSDDSFFFFKPHVRVTFDGDGKVMFCNAWADNNSASVSGGGALTGELAVKDGEARGKVSLKPDADAKRKHGFDVPSFELPLLAIPTVPAKDDKPKDEKAKPAKDDGEKGAAEPKPAAVHHKDLPLPDGAADVVYQKLTGQIRCKAPGTVDKVADALAKKLADQGWKTEGRDLVAKSATLRRKRGDATLTIFVKEADAANAGLTIMSSGLSWDEAK